MLRALNNFPVDRFASYNRFPPRRHLQKLFIFEIEFHFTILERKSQKVDLKVPFSISKNSIISNDLLAGAPLSINLRSFFMSSNFWNFLKFLIFLKKEFDSPLSCNCKLYLKKVFDNYAVLLIPIALPFLELFRN